MSISKAVGLLILGLGLAAVACNNPKNNLHNNPSTPTDTPAPVSGATVFKKQCQTCHGADGKLGLNGAKDLTQSTLSLEERIAVIHGGRGTMTAFREILSAEEIQAVAAYTQTLGK